MSSFRYDDVKGKMYQKAYGKNVTIYSGVFETTNFQQLTVGFQTKENNMEKNSEFYSYSTNYLISKIK